MHRYPMNTISNGKDARITPAWKRCAKKMGKNIDKARSKREK